MDQGISALIGVALGFLLSSVSSFVRAHTTGRRFANAARAELEEAKTLIEGKMRWILRDETGITPGEKRDPEHVVECYGRLLYLGEPEEFSVHLPFWEQNNRSVVEFTPAKSFKALFHEIVLINRFVAKFRDMKMAFTSGLGDSKWMATACLKDLIEIHDQLIPGKAWAGKLPSRPV